MNFVQSIFEYKKQLKRCENLDYFNFEELTKIDFIPPKHFNCVFLYGNYKAVSKLTDKKFNFLHDYLEHGVCFSNSLDSAKLMGYVERCGIKRIYTYSTIRKSLIENYLSKNNLKRRKVVSVGPYILGTNNFYDKKTLSDLKNRYGKILLVYPCHSIEKRLVCYDVDILISEINKHINDFDTVFMCLYWKDILEKKDIIERYKKEGYVIVCNGHRSDPYFLSRQKDLIMLSDMMLTNGLGTHIGYSICMNKPVYFIKQGKDILDEAGDSVSANNAFENLETAFQELFGKYSLNITENQLKLVKKYWGEWNDAN